MKIIKNSVKCVECGDSIESVHRWDYRECSCGGVAVDGGKDYLRRVFRDGAGYIDTSITERDEDDE